MAVKVVSEGPVKTKRVMCGRCWFQLEYTPADVVQHTVTDYGGGSDTYDYVKCPREGCGYETRVQT